MRPQATTQCYSGLGGATSSSSDEVPLDCTFTVSTASHCHQRHPCHQWCQWCQWSQHPNCQCRPSLGPLVSVQLPVLEVLVPVAVLVPMLVTCSQQWTRGQAGTDCSQYCTVLTPCTLYSTVHPAASLSPYNYTRITQPVIIQTGEIIKIWIN